MGIFSAGVFESTLTVGGSSTSTRVYNQLLSPALDGINTVFTTPNNFVANSITLYLGGIRQDTVSAQDYSVTGPNQITFSAAPNADQAPLIADYDLG